MLLARNEMGNQSRLPPHFAFHKKYQEIDLATKIKSEFFRLNNLLSINLCEINHRDSQNCFYFAIFK